MTTKHSSEFSELTSAGSSPVEAAKKNAAGRKVIAHLVTDVPAELIHAAGYYPVEVLAHHTPTEVGNSHFQSFTCTYGRGSIDIVLKELKGVIEGVIVPFICDTTRCVDIIFRDEKPCAFVECFRPPKSLSGPGAREYLNGEIKRLKSAIETYSGKKISDEQLKSSVKTYNRARSLLRKAEALRATEPRAYFDICRAFVTLPVEVFIDKMEKADKAGDFNAPKSDDKKINIILAGKMPEPADLPDVLTSMGARIVADDFAVGARLFAVDLDEKADPIDAMTERQFKQIPFAGFVQPAEDRPDFLLRKARENGAKGAILVVHKFCEIFELDAPEVRERLKRENLPTLVLEADLEPKVSGAARTRIEAFLEMISNG